MFGGMAVVAIGVKRASAQALTADTPQTTAMGTTFIAPPGGRSRCAAPRLSSRPPSATRTSRWSTFPRRLTPTPLSPPPGRPIVLMPSGRSKSRRRSPTRTAGRIERSYDYETSPNERRDVSALAGQHGESVDRRHHRHVAAHGGEAACSADPGLQPAAAQGLPARDVRRQEGPTRWTQLASRPSRRSSSARAISSGCAWRGRRAGPERQGRLRRRLRRPRARRSRRRSTPTRSS